MSRFDASARVGLAPMLLHVHGEPVTYRPRTGPPRTINAIVQYDVPQEANTSPITLVEVSVDPEQGITEAELDQGGDQIELPLRRGGPATRRKIASHTRPVAGMMTLEVH